MLQNLINATISYVKWFLTSYALHLEIQFKNLESVSQSLSKTVLCFGIIVQVWNTKTLVYCNSNSHNIMAHFQGLENKNAKQQPSVYVSADIY